MRIFLVRHGESLGNVDETAYARMGDHNVPLTDLGVQQAVLSGQFIRDWYAQRPDLADKRPRVPGSGRRRSA